MLYDIFINLYFFALKIAAPFNIKAKNSIIGRKNWKKKLEEIVKQTDNKKIIWVHSSSLGEYEQGLPLIKQLQKTFKNAFIVQSFSSPSGLLIADKRNEVDFCCYLPKDTKQNAQHFLDTLKPEIAIFVKYDFWYHILNQTNKRKIPLFLVSYIFTERSGVSKLYNNFLKKMLGFFNIIFAQNDKSVEMLKKMNVEAEKVGDTRFDRVLEIKNRDNHLDFLEIFKDKNKTTLVCGSTWEKDEKLIETAAKRFQNNVKFIIAPHQIDRKRIDEFIKNFEKKPILYSKLKNYSNQQIKDADIFIIDIVGILTKAYSYADIAYVGGGFTKSGIHNTLEPAVFGIPVICGKNIKRFQEAKDMKQLGNLFCVEKASELIKIIQKFQSEKEFYLNCCRKANNYVKSNEGAADKIKNRILEEISKQTETNDAQTEHID